MDLVKPRGTRPCAGLALAELLVGLALLGLVLAALLRPPRRRPPPTAPLAPLMDWVLWDLEGAEELLQPRPPGSRPVGPLGRELLLRGPHGEVRYQLRQGALERLVAGRRTWSRRVRDWGVQARRRPRGVWVVRVRLVGARDVLVSAAELGARRGAAKEPR